MFILLLASQIYKFLSKLKDEVWKIVAVPCEIFTIL